MVYKILESITHWTKGYQEKESRVTDSQQYPTYLDQLIP